MVAAWRKDLSSCKYLIQMGANPSLETYPTVRNGVIIKVLAICVALGNDFYTVALLKAGVTAFDFARDGLVREYLEGLLQGRREAEEKADILWEQRRRVCFFCAIM